MDPVFSACRGPRLRGRGLARDPKRRIAAVAAAMCRESRRSFRGLMAAFLLGVSLMLPTLAIAQSASPAATPSAASGDFAGLVDIGGGRRLYLECRGSGSPTVLLEAGYRSPATVWSDDLVQPDDPRTMVLEGVASFTRVCLYERPGVAAVLADELHPSRSDPVPMPRTVEAIVADLHALLQAAEVPGPYVLVGHSLGGLMVRLYQATYPDEVAGMVLVDAFSEKIRDRLRPEEWDAFLALNAMLPPEMADYVDYETIDFAAAVESMAEAERPLPLPLYVLARGLPLGATEEGLGFSPDRFEAAWRLAQDDLAALSPNAGFAVAERSAHYIQLDEPELVIEAVAEVVAAVREPGASSPVASPAP
ncbi:MAG: alpha/beta hydrolase [Chloroflexota bacterium]|nr:alpha/beta hydrolase [Chloroflexota bacterium]